LPGSHPLQLELCAHICPTWSARGEIANSSRLEKSALRLVVTRLLKHRAEGEKRVGDPASAGELD